MFNWFRTKVHHTVDDITSAFTSMVTQLEELAVRKANEAEANIAQALHLQQMADVAKDEAKKARTVIANVGKIFTNG